MAHKNNLNRNGLNCSNKCCWMSSLNVQALTGLIVKSIKRFKLPTQPTGRQLIVKKCCRWRGCVVFRVHINCFYTTGVPNLSCACGVHRFSPFLTFKRRLFEGCRLKFQFFSGVASPRSVLAAPSWRGMSSPLTSAGQIKTLIKLKPSRGADSPSLGVSHRSD